MSEAAVKIGLWGAPESGKTSYLGALAIAVDKRDGVIDGPARRPRSRVGSWSITPIGTGSKEYLYRLKNRMAVDRQFPDSTNFGAQHELSWGFAGNLAGSEFDRRPLPLRGRKLPSKFVLDLIDVHGGAYDRNPDRADNAASTALDHLADAEGIIYLFDPIAELASHDAIKYVDGTIGELRSIIYRKTEQFEEHLPHHVSVCVTKFDNQEMYRRAREMNFVFDSPRGTPMVRDEHAERLFDSLCSGEFWANGHEDNREKARLVRELLSSAFHPDRINYFITSSIGFSEKHPSAPFDSDRFQANYDGKHKIVGDVHPINVLEPLIRLQRQITRQRRR